MTNLIRKTRRRLGDIRRHVRARPARTQKQKANLLRRTSLDQHQQALLEKTESRISPKDGMYKGDGDHYFGVGLSAIECINAALSGSNLPEPKRILDLPCGHGRVLRFLVNRFPESAITACDLDTDGVDFCTETFDVSGAYSRVDLATLSLADSFDLIWCGSLITHLDETRIVALMKFFDQHLSQNGLLFFTAAGDRVRDRMWTREFDYGIAKTVIPEMVESYRKEGYAYTDYPYMADYGVSLTSPEWIRSRIVEIGKLREVFFAKHGWDNHQDVYGFIKS
ncbi:MAG TPA: class I SAM-dependent methyltransferase [Pyrinomonadaceae bacterium]|nr:class I SAM-dependent methyltransferase [Pyrinomonadaceae bacterium]